MTADRRRATWMGALLGALTAVLALALQARASDWQGPETQEFHQSYPLSANGQIELRNINGPVEIKAWDRNEVKEDAIKRLEQGAAAEQKFPSRLLTSIDSSGACRRARTPVGPPTRSVHRVSRRRSAKVGLAGHEQQGPDSFECFQISQAVE
jgi:hypothetical protein